MRGSVRGPAPVRVVFTGQSHLNIPAAPNNAPTFAMHGTGVPWANVAISGNGWYDLTNNATHLASLRAQARGGTGTNILCMYGGQGDIWNDSPSGQQTGATAHTRATSYATTARGYGYDLVVMCTVPPAGPNVLGTGRPTAGEVTALNDYNAAIRANTGSPWDAIADVNAVLDDATDTTYFDIDRTHYVAAGAQVAAGIIAAAIETLV